jgi:hypothetical protein
MARSAQRSRSTIRRDASAAPSRGCTASPDLALRVVAPLALDERHVLIGSGSATIASEIPGADQHQLFPFVAASAALRAMQAGDFERADELLTVAERAQVVLDAPRYPVLRVRAAFAYYRHDHESRLRWSEEGVALGRASSDVHELSAALTMP